MPKLTQTEDWVESLRVFIRDTLGNKNWQIRKGERDKVRLGIRFDDGSRSYKYLPYKWQRANANEIRHFIEAIHYLHIKKNIDIDEAFERTRRNAPTDKKPRKKTNPKILLDAWAKFEEYKRLVTGDVSSINNWNNEYGGEVLEGVRDRVMGKTYTRLKAVVIGDSFKTREGIVECKPPSNSNDLFIEMGKISGEAGSRMRANRLTQIREFLDYCTNTESNFLLESENWSPPIKGGITRYKGRKSEELEAKTAEPTAGISDKDLLKLIESLPIDDTRKDVRERAREWDLAIKLCIVYGLRPIEIFYLEVRKNGKDSLYCNYGKRAGVTTTKGRKLYPLHREWGDKWELVKRVKRGDKLPECNSGAGEGFRSYLKNNDVWNELKKNNSKVVAKSFRHSYGLRAHEFYKMHFRDVAPMMGHSVEVHIKEYSRYITEEILDDAMERAEQQAINIKSDRI